MIKITKTLLILLLIALFLVQSTVLADAAASEKQISISLTLNDGNITVNGEKITVEPPYLTGDNSTLVPLRVITSAFGALVTWDSATQTVGLKYNNQTINVTINSKQAIVDGKSIDMTTAPQLHNGTTMVPLRFITENFGAKLSFNAETKQIIITGSGAAADSAQTNLNTDAGKTKIGDSYNNWSMKYPTGLVKTNQNFRGTVTDFSDANDEYSLHVVIADSDVQNLSSEGLLNKLSDFVKDTILNKTTINTKDGSYAKVLSKDKKGGYSEVRAFFSNGKIYYLELDVAKEANYLNAIKYAGYKELLDTFKTTYNTKDFTIKDLSTVKAGFRKYTSDDYGFSLNIPADWYKADETASEFHFFSDQATGQDIFMNVSSITEGDTLDAWIAREKTRFTDTFTAAYGIWGDDQSITVNSLAARENISTQKPYAKWIVDDTIYIFKGKLKYNFDFLYPKDTPAADVQARRDAIVQSLTFTNKINPAIGFIADNNANRENISKIIKKDFGLSFEFPEFWSESLANEEKYSDLSYLFRGGSLNVYSSLKPLSTLTETIIYNVTNDKQVKLISNSSLTIAGGTGTKLVMTYEDSGTSYTQLIYIFGNTTKSYYAYIETKDAFATPANLLRFDNAVASIQLLP